MASTRDIFEGKFKTEDIVGTGSFFNNLEEVAEFKKTQQRFLPSVDFYKPSNFAKFGSAEEYYKNTITYINNEYPYDACTEDKLSWINSLSDFEYHIFLNEYPRSKGHIILDTTQKVVISSSIDQVEYEPKTSYENRKKYTHNTINFNNGLTFETWLSFEGDADILTINAVSGSAGILQQKTILKISRDDATKKFGINLDTNPTIYSNSTTLINKWYHCAFSFVGNTCNLFLDGKLVEEINISSSPLLSDEFILSPIGLVYKSIADINPSTANFSQVPPFLLGPGNFISFDETRLWNGVRSIEKIGQYWFTNIDGNDFNDINNSNLLFYFKYNEGFDDLYLKICMDYSGNDRVGEIINYHSSCRDITSGIDLSGKVQDIEKPDIVLKGLSYSTTVKEFYESKILSGKNHDETNMHLLYNKFPGWLLEQEESENPKHLRQIIQIVSSYFDDLYNKIGEVTKYKNIVYTEDKDNIYPFYDKILTSTGFDVTDLFTNLNIIEKISSRNDTTLFDEDIDKIKNGIFQNIYGNLSYILKSKGTSKSLKSFLRSYGVDENLIKINLYADNADFEVKEKTEQTVVRKKTLTMTGSNVVYMGSPNTIIENSNIKYYTLEAAVSFPQKLQSSAPATSSIFGVHNSDLTLDVNVISSNTNYTYYVAVENHGQKGNKFILSGSTGYTSSSYIQNLYDDTVWNLCIRKKPTIDTLTGFSGTISYTIELYGINNNTAFPVEFSCSLPFSEPNGYFRYYIGARNSPYTNLSSIYHANSKFFYCNFWTDYLINDIIKSHNKDVLNYGVDE